MGDRCSVYVRFGGRISTRSADALIEVLESECYRSNETDKKPCRDNLDQEFYAHEVSYGCIDEIESVCEEHRIDFEAWNDAGGSYGEQITRCIGGDITCWPTNEREVMFPASRILEAETLATGLGNLIAEARLAAAPLPDLVIDPTMPCPAPEED